MQSKFELILQEHFPFLEGKKLLLAISGGLDSMVLLYLCQLAKLNLQVAHCNFQLRDDASDADENFVKNYCKEHNIKCLTIKFDTQKEADLQKKSIQVMARELRYNWFFQLASDQNFDFILTAHHLDDSLETFLINTIRGTGLDGLLGIPKLNHSICRVLLHYSRNEIEDFAITNKILWREDASNASCKYTRNQLRHQVIPILKKMQPQLLSSFEQTLEHLQQSQSLVKDAAFFMFEKVAKRVGDEVHFDCEKLTQLSNNQAYMYEWLHEYGFTAWQDLYRLPKAQSGKFIESNTHIILKNRNSLILKPIENQDNNTIFLVENSETKINIPLNIQFCKATNISNSNANCIFVDEEQLQFPLQIRKIIPGDYFYPSGMNGKKKVSKFFKDEKYSKFEKVAQWLLCTENQIVWVIGKRADARFMANEKTNKIIKIELK